MNEEEPKTIDLHKADYWEKGSRIPFWGPNLKPVLFWGAFYIIGGLAVSTLAGLFIDYYLPFGRYY